METDSSSGSRSSSMQTISGIFNYLPEKHRHHVAAASVVRRNQTRPDRQCVLLLWLLLHYHFPADTYMHTPMQQHSSVPRDDALSLGFFFPFGGAVVFPLPANEEIV